MSDDRQKFDMSELTKNKLVKQISLKIAWWDHTNKRSFSVDFKLIFANFTRVGLKTHKIGRLANATNALAQWCALFDVTNPWPMCVRAPGINSRGIRYVPPGESRYRTQWCTMLCWVRFSVVLL